MELDHKARAGRPVEAENQIDVRIAFEVAQSLGILRENFYMACAVGGITGLDRRLFGYGMWTVDDADRGKADTGWNHARSLLSGVGWRKSQNQKRTCPGLTLAISVHCVADNWEPSPILIVRVAPWMRLEAMALSSETE